MFNRVNVDHSLFCYFFIWDSKYVRSEERNKIRHLFTVIYVRVCFGLGHKIQIGAKYLFLVVYASI